MFNYFAASFFKAHGIHFSRETKERDAPVVSAFSLSPLLCMRMISPVCQFFDDSPEHQKATWHTRV